MAYQRNPDNPLPDDDSRNAAKLDNELQVDPELAEGPASGGRVAIFAVAIAVILGVVFYGLNNSSINQPGTAQNATPATAQNDTASPPAAPPGMRDVTPHANSDQQTVGAAPARPQIPPMASPPGSTVNPRTGNPASQ
jgi:hypothetical protein